MALGQDEKTPRKFIALRLFCPFVEMAPTLGQRLLLYFYTVTSGHIEVNNLKLIAHCSNEID
jgi:hypothetical protein